MFNKTHPKIHIQSFFHETPNEKHPRRVSLRAKFCPNMDTLLHVLLIGQKTTLDTLQEVASSKGTNVKTDYRSLQTNDVVVNIVEDGNTKVEASPEPTGCVYTSTISCFRCKSNVARDKFLKEHLRVCARKIYCEVRRRQGFPYYLKYYKISNSAFQSNINAEFCAK